MSEFQINIVPFNVLQNKVAIGFSMTEKDGYSRIYKRNLPKGFPESKMETLEKFAWWTDTINDSDERVEISLVENPRFAKHYFNRIIFEFFASNDQLLTNRNFTNDTEVYVIDQSYTSPDFTKYNRFTLRIDNNDLIQGTSLVLSYDGDSHILNKNWHSLNISPESIGKLRYHNRITKLKFLTDTEKADRTNIFPFWKREIGAQTNIIPIRNFSENKYKLYHQKITDFYESRLKGVQISQSIQIVESGFYKPYADKIYKTKEDSNLLIFGNSQRHFSPYTGLKEYGPLESPPDDKAVRLIFVFHNEDKAIANKLYSYLKKGYKSFPGLESFVKLRFDIDTARSIQFSQQNPLEEIKTAFQTLQFDLATNRYAAIYISRIKKDTLDQDDDEVYYKLKELFLQSDITSQVIYKNNIDNPSFNYFLPNIAIALLAKLGGVPWRLFRPIKNDLVVGVGADRSQTENSHFIGCAFCFRNDGRFKGFNAFESTNLDALSQSIKDAIQAYIEQNKDGIERLVLHYYKSMSYEEEKPIRQALTNLNLTLPFVILTINKTEEKDYVLFDSSYEGKMPPSGTFIKTKWNEFILCNNTRYSESTGTRIDGFPLPISIKLKSSNYEKLNDMTVVRELIDQVYQFSRMYWKSVRQRNMPVTIEYSEIIARMIAHFDNKKLDPFARNSLWFL